MAKGRNGSRAAARALFFAGLLLLVAPAEGRAQRADSPGSPALDRFHEAVGGQVRAVALAIDRFFSNAEYEAEQNDTSLRLRFDADVEEPGDLDFVIAPRLRIRLPGTGRMLLFEAESEGESLRDDDGPDGNNLFRNIREGDRFELRLRLLRSIGDTLVSPEIGFGFDHGNPRAFVGGRARHLWELEGDWTLQLAERVRSYTDHGPESLTTFYADRLVLGDSLLRASFELEWQHGEPGVTYGPGIALYRPISERSAVGIEGKVEFETRPVHQVDEVVGAIRYRRRVLTDWSVIEVAPRIMFRDRDDYSPSAGLLLRLELEF